MAASLQSPTAPRLAPWPREVSRFSCARVFATAVAELIYMDLCRAFGFKALRFAVARAKVSRITRNGHDLDLVRLAVRDACVCYPRKVHCLQRSAAVTRMLRRRGIAAKLIVGCQARPLSSHAWVEVDNSIVWDRIPQIEYFLVIDRI